MREVPVKRCEACGRTRDLTDHHVYPKHLREVWKGRVKQIMAILCRTCHDVVHWRGGLLEARSAQRFDYVAILCNPKLQEVIGEYRRIIKVLERQSRRLHSGLTLDESLEVSVPYKTLFVATYAAGDAARELRYPPSCPGPDCHYADCECQALGVR
jgi:hypothetical protein